MNNAPGRSGWSSAYFLLLVPPLLWAGNVVLARGLADAIPPVAMSFWRWAGALLLLFPLALRQTSRDWPVLRRSWPVLLLLALLGIAAFNTLLYVAVQTTTALNCALLQAVMPAVILIICRVLYGERIVLWQMVGVVLCMIGVAWVVLQGDLQRLQGLVLNRGDAWMLLAVVCYATYSALLRRLPPLHPLSLLLVTVAGGCLMLLPLYLWECAQAPAWELTPSVLAGLAYVAVGPSILAYLCWIRGIAEIGAGRAGLFINLIPVFAAVLAVLLLGETWRGYHAVGSLQIISGMLLFYFGRAGKGKEEPS